MLVTRIFSKLWNLAEKFWHCAKKFTSPSHPTTENPLTEPLSDVPDTGSDPTLFLGSNYPSEITEPSPLGEGCQSSLPRNDGSSESIEPHENTGYTESKKEHPTKSKPREIPGKRGKNRQKQKSGSQQILASRPELICRKIPASGMWEVILSADNACPLEKVYLKDTQLDIVNLECHIPSLNGQLTVLCQNEQKFDIPLFDGYPLIFKLRKNWAGKGRKTSGITRGHSLVFTPAAWQRTGQAPIEPDGCTDSEFRVHYFHRDVTTQSESIDGFQECDVSPITPGIELTGQRVFDDSEQGDLFTGAVPILKASRDIEWVRVGEEAENGWKGENFELDKQSLSEVLNGREGHFFLRVYDSQVRLLDSAEFRHLRNLGQIRVNNVQYTQDTLLIPELTGYPSTEVRFVGDDGTTIPPTLLSIASHTTVHSGVLEVQPHPDADHISCTLGSGDRVVNVVLDLPRIWWRLEYDHSDLGDWRDSMLVMTRQEFHEFAHRNATMLLLSKRRKSVRVGFDNELDRLYSRINKEECITIPLDHFVDYAQIDRRLNDDAHFNVEWAGEMLTLIQISADPIPEIVSFTAIPTTIFAGHEVILQWATRNSNQVCVTIDSDIGIVEPDGSYSVWLTETTKYTLTLAAPGANEVTRSVTVTVDSLPNPSEQPTTRVRCRGKGWRNGKGFSFGELQDAGLTVQRATDQSIQIDRRRRSSHPANIETIRRMLND